MTGADRDRLATLERQVAELAADLERYRRDACTLRMLDEAADRAAFPVRTAPVPRGQHLRLVEGGAP